MKINATLWTDDEAEHPPARWCLVCRQPRAGGPMADAIAHAPCDQRLAAEFAQLDDDPRAVGFWDSIGEAGYDA